ncbi:MAG: HNH endonuclease [Clostridia bacterium]|nr:HNH endonuclease [Clostridia bacterium]
MAILISFLLIIVFCTIIFLIIVFEKNKDKEYLDYVVKNSISLCELYDLNKQFKFCDLIEDMEESHSYDNEKFFENISCEDYLIYQLQLKKYDVEKDIKNVEYNKRIYEKYIEEVAKITEFGRYKSENPKLKKTTLQTIEQKLFGENILKPKMKYVAHVILYCSKINGAVYKRKCRDFEEEKIKNLIKRLNDKNREFFNDRGIWDAICRVERGKVSNKMRFAIYKRDGYRCCNCGKTQEVECLEIDHIKPISKGGKSTYDNLQTLCKRCNKIKGDDY